MHKREVVCDGPPTTETAEENNYTILLYFSNASCEIILFLQPWLSYSCRFFTDTITSRYQLNGRYIASVLYENPYITIDLKQNASDKSFGDVDIADVAYYFEKDVKGQSIFHNNAGLNVSIDNEPVKLEKTVVYYVDEIAPEFSMKSLTPGLIAVIVVVVIAIVAAIVVLVLTRRRKGKYVKAEVKEMNEMHRGLNA
ncbi:PREDICTED: epithelial cell adhesion molecule-like [Sturnus vulgaris]|uniref:epithelial cell adhesion molecule-like n=1 Tax=Sturnus vulgaris TaxID=9172 RepID=UPI000719FC78|nr:PREDICTED: epithelial cell adhesion molecule-like [Sturnus vulgaris]